MYSIYADNVLFYRSDLQDFEEYRIFNPVLTKEFGEPGSIEFTMAPGNVCYESIVKMKTQIYVYKDDEEIFRGRVLDDTKDFYNQKKVYCEGDLAYLLDSFLRPYKLTTSPLEMFKNFLNQHNAQVDQAKKFEVGNVTVKDKNDLIVRENSEYSKTYEEMKAKLTGNENLGGYLVTRKADGKRYLDYVDSYIRESKQVIRFGENLLDLNQHIDASEIYTVLIPLGKTLEGENQGRLDIKSVNNGKDYLESSEGIRMFGRIVNVKIWEDVTVAANLKTKAQADINEAIKSTLSIDLTAVDLSMIDVNSDDIRVGDRVLVISEPHGVNDYFICQKIEKDFQNPENDKYTFGSSQKTLTGFQTNTAGKVNAAAYSVENATSSATSANAAASSAAESAAEAVRKVDELVNAMYPIGSIYMSVSDKNPSEYFGGVWEAWGSGRVPVGVNSTDSDFSTVEKTGGSKEMQKHYHKSLHWNTPASGAFGLNASGTAVSRITFTANAAATDGFVTGEEGTGNSGNLQPYITCFMWKRTE